MQATSAKEAAPSQPENTSQTSTIARSRRSIDLDFLRGLAIFLVLDFHYGSKGASLLSWPLRKLGLPHFGWGGVDLFFVLSGFLVGGLLIEEWREYHSINVPRFLLRRALKIAPPYYVFLIVMLLRHLSEWRAYIGSFLNIQNYYGINDNVHTLCDHMEPRRRRALLSLATVYSLDRRQVEAADKDTHLHLRWHQRVR